MDALNTYDVDFQHHFHLFGWNNIVWGVGYRYTQDNVANSPNLQFLPAHFNENLYSGFLQDELKLHENLFLTLGSKIEHNDYTGFEYEPSGRLQWNVTTNQMLWGAVSRAVRTPSRVDEDEFLPTYLPKAFPQYIISRRIQLRVRNGDRLRIGISRPTGPKGFNFALHFLQCLQRRAQPQPHDSLARSFRFPKQSRRGNVWIRVKRQLPSAFLVAAALRL